MDQPNELETLRAKLAAAEESLDFHKRSLEALRKSHNDHDANYFAMRDERNRAQAALVESVELLAEHIGAPAGRMRAIVEELGAKRTLLAKQRRELDEHRRANEARNRRLDALHYVWCTGNCTTGAHRYGDHPPVTAELLVEAIRSVLRMAARFHAAWDGRVYPKYLALQATSRAFSGGDAFQASIAETMRANAAEERADAAEAALAAATEAAADQAFAVAIPLRRLAESVRFFDHGEDCPAGERDDPSDPESEDEDGDRKVCECALDDQRALLDQAVRALTGATYAELTAHDAPHDRPEVTPWEGF